MAISFERLNKVSVVGKLTLANFVIFIGLNIVGALHSFFPSVSESSVVSFLGCPSSFPLLVQKPWTIISYSFAQYDPAHAILNILWLIWVGALASQLHIPQSRILLLYLLSAIIGGATYIIASTLAGVSDSMLLGSSAAVISLAVAVAVTRPSIRVSIPLLPVMPVVIPVAVIVVVEACLVTVGNPGGHFAHIGGIVTGLLSGLFWRQHIVVMPSNSLSEVSCDDTVLLQKVRTSGFESLSPEERDFLYSGQQIKSTNNSQLR